MIISGEQLQSLAEISFCSEKNCIIQDQLNMMQQNVHLIDSFPVAEIKNYKRIFVYSHDLKKFFNKFYNELQDGITLLSHNSDYPITEEFLPYLEGNKIKKWFCQNRYINHPKLFSLPIGVANSQWKHGNQNTIQDTISKCLPKKFLIYKNFDKSTNIQKRSAIDQITQLNGIPMDYNRPYNEYLEIVAQSIFVISPPGNGVDCHRIWECLSLNAIPIVERHTCFNQFEHLPILFIDKWEEVNNKYVLDRISIIKQFVNPIKELSLDYWKELICTE